MARKILFGILGFIAGFATNIAGFMLMEVVGFFAHPYPADFKMDNPESVAAYIRTYPDWLLAIAVGMWGLSVMAAAWVGTRVGGRVAGIVLCLSLLVMYYCNLLQYPYPFWFKAAGFVSIPICLFIGYQMVAAARESPSTDKKT
jgi:hypothetical protein